MRRFLPFGALGAALVAASAAPAQFTDVTASVLDPNHQYHVTSGHGLGLVWVDVNNDGFADLFATNGIGLEEHLWLNNGDGTFDLRDDLLPVLPEYDMMGAVYADYDNDGDNDIYIFTDNENFDLWGFNSEDGPPNLLLRNRFMENGGQILAGQPLFNEIGSLAGVDDAANPPFGAYPAYRSSTGGWIDYDRDGWVDLYVVHWVLQGGGGLGNMDKLYRNNGDGTFSDATVAAGLNDGTDPNRNRPGLVWISADFDGNQWPDMWVGNVHDPDPYHYDQIWGNTNGMFIETTGLSPGVGDDTGAAMGIDVADPDLDGDWDVYITDMFDNMLDQTLQNSFYINNGDGTFQDTTAIQLGIGSTNSWGCNWFDVDHDGLEDLYVNTMDGFTSHLFWNRGNLRFQSVGFPAGFQVNESGRGSATADYDNDGDLDLATIAEGGTLRLWRNDTITNNHWLKLRLEGTASNRSAIGAEVRLFFDSPGGAERSLMRVVKGGSSAHSQDDLVVHFGTRNLQTVKRVEVLWPSGNVTTLNNVATDQTLSVVE